jgi:hypothetical protein
MTGEGTAWQVMDASRSHAIESPPSVQNLAAILSLAWPSIMHPILFGEKKDASVPTRQRVTCLVKCSDRTMSRLLQSSEQ